MRLAMRKNDVLYDVGANIGLVSILMAKYAAELSATVHCFEPEPNNYRQLSNNIHLNNLDNFIVCHKLALGDIEGDVDLHVRGSHAGEGRHSIATGKGATSHIPVKLTTMSRIVGWTGQVPTIVKIDVEGAEGRVLSGMQDLIRDHPPREIFLEIHAKGDGDSMPNGESIDEWLRQRGYSIVWKNTRRAEENRHYQQIL